MVRVAIKALAKSDHKFAFHGALVIKGGAVVAVGYNHGHTHAEVQALSKLWPSKRRGCKVLSIRMTAAGKITMAKPCPACEGFLKESGVKKVLYSDETGQMVSMRL